MRAIGWRVLLLCVTAAVCGSCESDEFTREAAEGGLYTRYNLHYVAEGGRNKASYANWTEYPGHGFLPYNTRVRATFSSNKIYFVAADTGMRIDFEYNASRMGMFVKDYIAMITSPTPVAYEGLSDVDRQGIETGKAIVGMSKQGVTIALGYPAVHQTPSLEERRWVYWKGRHNSYAVEFDENGKVVSVTN